MCPGQRVTVFARTAELLFGVSQHAEPEEADPALQGPPAAAVVPPGGQIEGLSHVSTLVVEIAEERLGLAGLASGRPTAQTAQLHEWSRRCSGPTLCLGTTVFEANVMYLLRFVIVVLFLFAAEFRELYRQ